MRLYLLMICTTVLSFAPNSSLSQEKVYIDRDQKVSVDQVFKIIKKQSEFRFLYPQDLFKDAPKINLIKGEITIKKLLEKSLQGLHVDYKVQDKRIILHKELIVSANKPLPQGFIVQGTLRDVDSIPLPGVTVRLKGTQNATSTNLDGEYRITVPGEETVLVFTSIGFKAKEIEVGGQRNIDVILIQDVGELSEVVINAGYYNTTERERTGNIARVSGEDIQLQPVVNPLQALQGRMAGVEVTSGGSHPGMASTIRIRGTNSLREEGNYPLYIIDGVPINSTPIESNTLMSSAGIDPLNSLDVSNIESIEVLKDADATAIYGSRGANGVVLITTKVGSASTAGLTARYYTGTATVPSRLDLLNTEEYLAVRARAFENDGVEMTERNAYDLLLWDQQRYTDWQDFIFGGTSNTTNAKLDYSDGNENTIFRLGGGYFTQGTVYPGDYNYQKITGSFNLNHHSKDRKFNLNLSTNYGVDVNELTGGVSYNLSNVFLSPNAPAIFLDNGDLNWQEWGDAGLDNPLAGYFNNSTTNSNTIITNLGLSYQLLKGLELKTSLGYTHYNSRELLKRPIRSYNPADAIEHRSSHINSYRDSWIMEPQLNYTVKIKKLAINSILGGTFQENKSSLERFQGSGYASEALIGNLGAAESIVNASGENNTYRYAAIFSRIGLNWDRKYYLNFTGRRDGSSRFGTNNRFANFGAIGTAWIFSDENIVEEHLPFLSFGKIRASYGTTGNDQIGDYGYLEAYEATIGVGGLYPTGLANPNYSWEVNKKLEGGIELGFINDRIRFGISYYRNRSSNQLVGYPLPYITGFTSVQANLPATVENRGWEIEVNSQNIQGKDFNWATSFNLSIPKNELLRYPDIEQSSYANTYRIGHPLNISLLYNYTGLDPETGLYTIEDSNEDGSYDYQDQNIIQNNNRQLYGGLNNNITFKGISLQFLWEFVKQEGRITSFSSGTISNSTRLILSRLEGDNSIYQQISQTSASRTAYNRVLNTAFPIKDASYLRLKNISLAYKLPRVLTSRLDIENIQFFIHGQNLFTLTNYDGLDPERPGLGLGNLRTITGGIEVKL
ncbi:SusC/RagA family TonB-linked outer membrane protein [Zunongwangia sp.]|uniref:SusC/RagA family TonB-linked outer membrane protein n=1 Tax=Zunongwangia sp. TaxID=1965325 RepID=UPI0032423322